MTDDRLPLKELLEKIPDANYLREMIGFAAQRLMELDIERWTGAARGKRSPERPCTALWRQRPRLGDPRRNGGIAHPEAAQRRLFPWLSRTAPDSGDRGQWVHLTSLLCK
jgi:hypothetical protein